MESSAVVKTDPVDRVKNMVRHALVASPNVTNKELYERAMEIAPAAVEDLSLRQFHARFRLPVMRHEMGPRIRARRDAARATQSNGASGSVEKASTKKPKREKRTRSRSRGQVNGTAPRAEVRRILADFAVELEKAEQRSELVRVMADLEMVVDRILSIAESHYAPVSRSTRADEEAREEPAAA